MDEETVGFVLRLAVATELRAHGLGVLARVGEHQALLVTGVLEDVAKAWVGLFRGVVACRGNGGAGGELLLHDGAIGLRVLIARGERGWPCEGVGCLGTGCVKVLHREQPTAAWLFDPGDHPAPSGARGQEGPHGVWVAYGGGEADAARVDAGHAAEALDEADGLSSAVAAQQRVNLVDDDEAQVAEEACDGGVPVEKQGLERLGRNLQYAAGVLEHPCLV